MSEVATWRRTAFAPAHLTGFFAVDERHANPYRRGSVGAGLNLEQGVTATVQVREAPPGTAHTVEINGQSADAPTVHATLGGLLGDDYAGTVHVALHSPLPSGQGFGLSGAGALATGIALADLLGFPAKTALWEAHKAEVEAHTGLGDVPAQYAGGAEIRVTPGAQPMGVVERFGGLEARRADILCLVLDQPLSTASVLQDEAQVARINSAGRDSVDMLRAEPTLAMYLELAAHFTDQVGLAGPPLQAALSDARRFGPAAQTMLGNALHLVIDPDMDDATDPDAAAAALSKHGTVYRSRVTLRGAHVKKESPTPEPTTATQA